MLLLKELLLAEGDCAAAADAGEDEGENQDYDESDY